MNNNPLVFLDVDGVINSERWFHSEEYQKRHAKFAHLNRRPNDKESQSEDHIQYLAETHIDPAALAILNEILKVTAADIVVSSTWRGSEISRKALEQVGIDRYKERLRGFTPHRATVIRGYEIQEWLDTKEFKGRFAILDDDDDMAHLKPYLVKTSWGTGLLKKHKEKVIKLLLT